MSYFEIIVENVWFLMLWSSGMQSKSTEVQREGVVAFP
jgi:hypothetical protein